MLADLYPQYSLISLIGQLLVRSLYFAFLMYCLDEKALLLYQKGADSMAGWAANTGHILTVVPSGTEQFELPFQNLAGIWGFTYYYDYTEARSVLETVYPVSKKYLLDYRMNPDGLVAHRSGSWDWADWGDNADIVPMENAWYYMAAKSCMKMAGLLGYHDDIALYEERMRSIAENFDRVLLKDGHYYQSTADGYAEFCLTAGEYHLCYSPPHNPAQLIPRSPETALWQTALPPGQTDKWYPPDLF